MVAPCLTVVPLTTLLACWAVAGQNLPCQFYLLLDVLYDSHLSNVVSKYHFADKEAI